MVMPSFFIWRPRSSAKSWTCWTVWVWASTRADGPRPPISDLNRDTRPPSSSTPTASGSGPAPAAISASAPSVNIDKSVSLPMMMPPTWRSVTTALASAASRTPTISSWASLSRVGRSAGTAGGSAHTRGAGAAAGVGLVADGLGPSTGGGGSGAGAAVAASRHQRGCGGEHSQCARKSHPAHAVTVAFHPGVCGATACYVDDRLPVE